MARCAKNLVNKSLHLSLHRASQLGQDITHLVDLTALAKGSTRPHAFDRFLQTRSPIKGSMMKMATCFA
jgi:hypothetical protein